jgi:hypothetical protein
MPQTRLPHLPILTSSSGSSARSDARGPVCRELLSVGSHYCQFAGWLGQDTMDAAQEAGDADMVTSVLSLKSHLAWSRGDAATAVGLAQAGQRGTPIVSPWR